MTEGLHPRLGAIGRGVGYVRARSADKIVLAALVVAGICLRTFGSVVWWPTIPTFPDAMPYSYYAGRGPLLDPQHPAGYAYFLRAIGFVTHNVAAVTLIQHALGIATALVLYAAVRRVTGSPWPALVPAAVVLLNADQVYQEQLIASEPLSAFLLCSALYATVRAIDSRAGLGWALGAGGLISAATIVRTQDLLVGPVLALGLWLARRGSRPAAWQAGLALLCVWLLAMLGYGWAKYGATGQFQITPSPGWTLYGRAATFADCHRFTPPRGTAVLCEPEPEARGQDWYMFNPGSPAVRRYGHFGLGDAELLAWAEAAIEHQPGDYLASVGQNLLDYYVPSTFTYVPGAGGGLDGELDWSVLPSPSVQSTILRAIQWAFFDRFQVSVHWRGLSALHSYQRIFRFGATLLTIATLLTLVGLVIGTRRTRFAVLVFGLGALMTLLPGAFSESYEGRYTVPLSGPLAAAASIAAFAIWRAFKERRNRVAA